MRGIIHNQLLHTFVEGPVEAELTGSDVKESVAGAPYPTDPANGNEINDEIATPVFYTDRLYHEANERYD
jgi:hypothetical protein